MRRSRARCRRGAGTAHRAGAAAHACSGDFEGARDGARTGASRRRTRPRRPGAAPGGRCRRDCLRGRAAMKEARAAFEARRATVDRRPARCGERRGARLRRLPRRPRRPRSRAARRSPTACARRERMKRPALEATIRRLPRPARPARRAGAASAAGRLAGVRMAPLSPELQGAGAPLAGRSGGTRSARASGQPERREAQRVARRRATAAFQRSCANVFCSRPDCRRCSQCAAARAASSQEEFMGYGEVVGNAERALDRRSRGRGRRAGGAVVEAGHGPSPEGRPRRPRGADCRGCDPMSLDQVGDAQRPHAAITA